MLQEIEKRLQTAETARKIQELDPLGIDSFMIEELPKLNNSRDVNSIINFAQTIELSESRISEMNDLEAHATLRDLGMIASSIQKHGVPTKEVPNLENSLILLGTKLDETPRETVFHYGPWNPEGSRMRTFTGTDEEKLFIQSFREGMSGLDESINSLLEVQGKSVFDLNFAHTLNQAKDGFQKMIDAMVEVRRKITPEFFSFQMRPYFPVLTIGGQEYQAPGGAQMPVLIVDRIIWGVDSTDETYQAYYNENVKYLPKIYRNIAIGNESIVTRVLKDNSDVDLDSAKGSLSTVLKGLLMFRYPHLKTAKENFEKREEGSKGSGGYNPSILETLIELTTEAKKKIDAK